MTLRSGRDDARPPHVQNEASRGDDATSTSRFALIAAVARNGVIGTNRGMPWRLPQDLAHFRALTMGHGIIMGRITWETLNRALPGRQNIVVTRRHDYDAPGADVVKTLDQALASVRQPLPAFCIGGGELYRVALPRADTLHLTEIDCAFDGDTTFPSIDRREWRECARESHRAEGASGFDYAFVTYRRVGS